MVKTIRTALGSKRVEEEAEAQISRFDKFLGTEEKQQLQGGLTADIAETGQTAADIQELEETGTARIKPPVTALKGVVDEEVPTMVTPTELPLPVGEDQPKVPIEGLDIVKDREAEIEPVTVTAPELEITRDKFRDIQDKVRLGQELTDEEKRIAARVATLTGEGQTQAQIFGEEAAEVGEGLLGARQAQDLGARLASGSDRELENLGLSQIQFLDDERVRTVLKESLGLTDAQAEQVIARRNLELDKKKVEERGVEAISEAEKAIDERLKADTDLVKKQGADRIKTQQRLRSQRGLGRGSATERIIADEQAAVDALVRQSETTAAANKAIFKAQQEGADAVTISALQKNLAEQEEALAGQLQVSIDAQIKTNEELKVDFETSVKDIMGTLTAGGEDVSGIDVNKSKNLGYFVNSDGSIFLNKSGAPVTFKSDAVAGDFTPQDVDNFAEGILAGSADIKDVPTEIKSQVLKSLALKKGTSTDITLTPLMKAKSQKLAKEIFGTVSKDGTEAIEGLFLEGLSEDEIRKNLTNAGFTPELANEYKNALGNILRKGFTEDQKEFINDELNRRVEEHGVGSQEVNEFILGSVNDKLSSTVKEKVDGRIQTIGFMKDIKTQLQEYIDAGGDTGLLTGSVEKLSEKVLKTTNNPKLAEITTSIQLAIQDYRRAISGAAFTESEAQEYEDIFPSATKDVTLNTAKINSLIDTFGKFTDGFYKRQIGASSFNTIFPDGVMNTINPGIQVGGVDENDETFFTEIEAGPSAEIKGEKTESGFQVNFETSGFNGADQTTTTEGLPQKSISILGESKAFVTPKGGDNKVLGKQGGSLTFRTNNPLAITLTNPGQIDRLVKKFGARDDVFSPDSADNLVLNFNSIEEGLEAGKQLLEEKGDFNLTRLAESHTGGQALSHKKFMEDAGLDLARKFSDLTEEEKEEVILAFSRAEGFTQGTTLNNT